MSLLKTAVKARIPIIAAKTDDPAYLQLLVTELTGKKPLFVKWRVAMGKQLVISSFLNEKQLGIMEYVDGFDWEASEAWLEKNDSVLIVFNAESHPASVLDVGTLTVPPSLVTKFVKEWAGKANPSLNTALAGLSITSMKHIAAMATAEYGEFTADSVRKIRREFFQTVRGLEELSTDQLYYHAPTRLQDWLTVEGKLFKQDTPALLTPRGFLFSGPPGTGKTSGAKYLAKQLDIPLYRLDMGMVLSKWIGEADQRLSTALNQADSFGPCVLLIDEVEKLFEATDGSGVVTRLLGYLLWWLQEHRGKVLVVMTTNNQKVIPPELYRPGRIDEEINFTGLLQTQVLPFMLELAKRLEKYAHVTVFELEILAKMWDKGPHPQAWVTEQVLKLIKVKMVEKLQETKK